MKPLGILFRGKRVDGGKWVYGVPVYSVNDRCYMIHGATEDAINTKNEVDFIYSEVIPETVGMYTGESAYCRHCSWTNHDKGSYRKAKIHAEKTLHTVDVY